MLLSFENVFFSYKKGTEVLKDISFTISEGEKVALVGLNGSGKSTLMLHCNGLLQPEKGRVCVNNIPTNSKNLSEVRKQVGLVFQNPEDQLFMPTVWDDVAFGPRNMKLSEEEVKIRVNEALEKTHMHEFSGRNVFELSGGQKKSASIATVLSMRPQLLVMDEPTSGMDYQAVNNFIRIMESLPQALLLSTHDFTLAQTLCNRVIYLEEGKKIYDGAIDKFSFPPNIN